MSPCKEAKDAKDATGHGRQGGKDAKGTKEDAKGAKEGAKVGRCRLNR